MLLIAKMESQIFDYCISLIHQLHKANKSALKRSSWQFPGRRDFSVRTCFGKIWKGKRRKSKVCNRQKQSETSVESKKWIAVWHCWRIETCVSLERCTIVLLTAVWYYTWEHFSGAYHVRSRTLVCFWCQEAYKHWRICPLGTEFTKKSSYNQLPAANNLI